LIDINAPGDDVIDDDLILVWTATKRVITGSDLLGRLLRDIAKIEKEPDRMDRAAAPAIRTATS